MSRYISTYWELLGILRLQYQNLNFILQQILVIVKPVTVLLKSDPLIIFTAYHQFSLFHSYRCDSTRVEGIGKRL